MLADLAHWLLDHWIALIAGIALSLVLSVGGNYLYDLYKPHLNHPDLRIRRVAITTLILLVVGLSAGEVVLSRANTEPPSPILGSNPTFLAVIGGLSCSIDKAFAKPGDAIRWTSEITAQTNGIIGVGHALYDESGMDAGAGAGDTDQEDLKVGSNPKQQVIKLPKDIKAGQYEVVLELWPPHQIGRDGVDTIKESQSSGSR